MMRLKPKQKQKGVALFITLLVITIATLLATEIWFRNSLDIARQSNNRASYQSYHYARGMALWAKDILRKDYEENPEFDSSGDVWNQPISGIQLEDAVLSGQMYDMNSKFNLNNLYFSGNFHPPSVNYFRRLLANLQMDVGIADKIIDWMDENQVPMQMGAEDVSYLSQNPAYRTAGQPFQHISELRLIEGINEEIYQRLKQFVTVLPLLSNSPTKLNVNTAPAVLLKSLDDKISQRDALLLYKEGGASYRDIGVFFSDPIIRFYNLGQTDIQQLVDTKTEWFDAQIMVTMESNLYQRHALMLRKGNNAVVNQWSATAFFQ